VRICINVINGKSWGITNYTRHLVINLVRLFKDIEITLFASNDVIDRYKDLAALCIVKAVPVRNFIFKTLYINVVFPFVSGKFDIVHSTANIGILFPQTIQIMTIHDCYETRSPERFGVIKRVLQIVMKSISIKHSAVVLADSENTAKDVITAYPHASNKTVTIALGSTVPIIKQEDACFEKNGELLFVGTVEVGKNLITVLKALRILSDQGMRPTLKVIGARGWGQSHIPELLEEFELTKQILFCGYVSDENLALEYRSASALVFASSYEGFGLPVIEAMASGCPVIAARNSSIPEAGGDAALYFETLDEINLSERIIELLSDKDLQRECISKGLKQAATFSWERTAQEVYGAYTRSIALNP